MSASGATRLQLLPSGRCPQGGGGSVSEWLRTTPEPPRIARGRWGYRITTNRPLATVSPTTARTT